MPLWDTGRATKAQLSQPIGHVATQRDEILEHGLGAQLASTAKLRAEPDFDVLAWVVERWLRPTGGEEAPDPLGWAHFTLFDLGSDLYGRDERASERKHRRPDGADRDHLRASLFRLRTTLLTVRVGDGTRARESAPITEFEGEIKVMSARSWREIGALRGSTVDVRLASWLMAGVQQEPQLRFDFATLRRLRGAAKRTWIFLEAEDWKTKNPRAIGLGPPALRVLGVGGYERTRAARAALARAVEEIMAVDPRYRLEVRRATKKGGNWQLRAERLTREKLAEHRRVAKQAEDSIAEADRRRRRSD